MNKRVKSNQRNKKDHESFRSHHFDMLLLYFLLLGLTAADSPIGYPNITYHEIVPGDFDEYREIWNNVVASQQARYLVCSNYQKTPSYAKNWDLWFDDFPIIPTYNQKYVISYKPGELHLDIYGCDPKDIDAPSGFNIRRQYNYPGDMPEKSFMFRTILLINKTHAIETTCLGDQPPKYAPINTSVCNVKPMRELMSYADVSPAQMQKIELHCFNKDQNYCAFISNTHGDFTGGLITLPWPIMYSRYGLTVYYKPPVSSIGNPDEQPNVFIYYHEKDMHFYIPRNLKTFTDPMLESANYKPKLKVPLFHEGDNFFKRL
ncbi:hypothetical protein M3Y95_00771300 [Aphelenchoides besseyi]|nr:hypothetical protein M3Y95_00771300 [Aphelenchoides besseyi]